ncbi:MAG: YopX family protein [Sporolactobacillus sp.]
MQKIKFRAWDEELKTMCRVNAIDFDNGIACIQTKGIIECHNRQFDGHHDRLGGELEPCKLMQFTGLKDKNGIEIYESDILSDGKELYLVKYSFTETGMIASGLGKEGTWSLYHLATNHNKGREIEVVGNIYQNSDLLKEGQTNG